MALFLSKLTINYLSLREVSQVRILQKHFPQLMVFLGIATYGLNGKHCGMMFYFEGSMSTSFNLPCESFPVHSKKPRAAGQAPPMVWKLSFFSSEDGRFTRFGKPPEKNMARLDVFLLIGDMCLSIVECSIVILVFPRCMLLVDQQ